MAPPNGEKSAGKAKLTLERLASYDDCITDALVDKVGAFLCGGERAWFFASPQSPETILTPVGLLLDDDS